jgi:hypothetical protein
MPMRKTRVRERRLRIEPTSRPSDLVCLLFSQLNCDARSNFVQAKVVDRAQWIIFVEQFGEKEISHCRVSWQTHWTYIEMGTLAESSLIGV